MDQLPEVILEKILTYCESKDAIQLRATCTKLEKKSNEYLIRASLNLNHFKQKNYHEELKSFEGSRDDTGFFISIRKGKSSFKNKQKAIKSALKNVLMEESDEEMHESALLSEGRTGDAWNAYG